MTRCPHCQKIANPLRFFAYSRWSPYRCPSCGKTSVFSILSLTLVGTTGAVLACIAEAAFHLNLLGTIAVGIVLILCMMSFLRLKPKEPTSEQHAGQVSPEAALSASPDEPSA